MEYKKFKDTYYIRGDRGDELVTCILEICRKENIASATYSGIGGCENAVIQTFNPETSAFSTTCVEGMLELVSFTGNVISGDNGEFYSHTHALFAYVEDGEHRVIGGHLKSSTVRYTAEIELRPVQEGAISYRKDPETGTGFWVF